MTSEISIPHPNVIKKLDMVKHNMASSVQNQVLNVFLLGPYIRVDQKKSACKSGCLGTQLRHSLYWDLYHQYDVFLGEFKELTSSTASIYGRSKNNSSLAEIHYARKEMNAIVILPSSPGSFVEFGSFLVYEDICKKMLVIIDAQYKEKSYISEGAVPMARNNGAKVLNLCYKNDVGICKDKVNDFIMSKSTERFGKNLARITKRGKRS